MRGWPEVSVGDVCEFKYGKSLREDSRSGGPFPVYGSNGVVGYHSVPLTDGATIVIGRKGSFGEVHVSELPCWPIDTTYYVDRSATQEDLRWLAYRLGALGLNTLNRAAAVPGLNREDAYRRRFLLPPLADQRRIVAILDRADALRAKRRAALAQLNTLAKAIFIEMFGDPVVNTKGWPRQALAAVGSLDRGLSKHRPRNAPHLLGGSYPFVQTGDIANCDGWIRTYEKTYSEAGLRQSRLWPAGTLCITIAANIAETGILLFDACFPDSVVGFRAEDPSTVVFIRECLRFVQASLEEAAPESAQKNINLQILRNLTVPVPPIALRRLFAARVEATKRLVEHSTRHAAELGVLFSSLQQRAFRGEL